MLYLAILFALLINSVFLELSQGNRPVRAKGLYILYLFIFVLIAGLRWKVGGDSMTYQKFFENNIPTITEIGSYSFTENKFEPFFVFLMSLCKTIYNEFWFFQLTHALIVNIIIFKFIRNRTLYKFTGLLLYFVFYYLYFNTEILRESLAICGFILIYPYFEKGDWKRYYFYTIIVVLFHYSGLVLLLFPIFKNTRLRSTGQFTLALTMLAFILIVKYGSGFIASVLGTDSIIDRYEQYSNISYSLNGMIFLFLVFVLAPYILHKFNKRFSIDHKFENLVFTYFLLACVYVAVSGFGRFLNYLGPFMIVYLCNTLYGIINSRHLYRLRFSLVLLLLIVPAAYKSNYYLRSTDKYFSGTRAYHLWYPYSSVFEKEEYYFREIIYQESMRESYRRTLSE